MANPTTRFVSVNLNKSYGQQQQQNASRSSPAYANGGIGQRARPSAAGAGGRGMVVLSRSRGAGPSVGQKATSKLSVPAPLNLPSLRKEHERFDPTAPGSNTGTPSSALGSGSGSSMMGWNKPTDAARDCPSSGEQPRGSIANMLLNRGQCVGMDVAITERAVLLRGEDFPSLKATSLSSQKQKISQAQRQHLQEERVLEKQVNRPSSEPVMPMRPHGRSFGGSELKELANKESALGQGISGSGKPHHKPDGLLSGPLPIIQFKHTSDWADDERDTSHAILDRGKDRGFSRVEPGRAFDYLDGRISRDFDGASTLEKEHGRVDSIGRDVHMPGKNSNSWRSPLHSREGFSGREGGLDRDGLGSRFSNHSRDSIRDTAKSGNGADIMGNASRPGHVDQHQNLKTFGRHGQTLQARGTDMYNGRRYEPNDNGWHFDASGNRHKGDSLQKYSSSKLSTARSALPDDPVLNFGRDNHNFANNGKIPLENNAFESRDPFSAGLPIDINTKLLRRKKDVLKQSDFHDPVRESFEAELERVQKLQEEERQRALQENARALELARKEEEERGRMIREEEERRRRLEEEAREVAWREEQERINMARRTEEQRVAREEEKKRILMEEERRKAAARLKLLELEAKIAKRQAEEAAKDIRSSVSTPDDLVDHVNENRACIVADNEYWEDGEQLVQRVMGSGSSDRCITNGYAVSESINSVPMEGSSSYAEQGKFAKGWKNEAHDAGNSSFLLEQENEPFTNKHEIFIAERTIHKKSFSTNQDPSHPRPSKGSPPNIAHKFSDLNILKDRRWITSGEGEQYSRNVFDGSNFDDSKSEVEWDHNHPQNDPNVLYSGSGFPNLEVESLSSTSRSRYSLRQPRVFPPPTFTTVHRGFPRDDDRQPSTTYFESKNTFQTAEKSDSLHAYESEDNGQDRQRETPSKETTLLLKPSEENASRCGSQSSVSVSNPPTSPTHPSHEDFDDSAEFPSLAPYTDGSSIAFSEQITAVVGMANLSLASRSPSREEWSSGNNTEVQEEEEYDDVEDRNDDGEPLERDVNILEIGEDFVLSSGIQSTVAGMEHDHNVLGFNDGVEVLIPRDDFDGPVLSIEKKMEIVSKDGTLWSDSPDGAIGDEADLHVDKSSPVENENTSEVINDTDDVSCVPKLEHSTCTVHAVYSSEIPSSVVASIQTIAASTFDFAKPCSFLGEPAPLSVSTVPVQAKAPVQLQFGLFSGPSLIPSPVPAIQIGSIQMPLNIHPPIGPSHVHSSQPPFFQFGQLRYTSSISQGILPIGSQSIPYVQPSAPVHYSVDEKPLSSFSDHALLNSSATSVQKGTMVLSDHSPIKSSYGEQHFDESQGKSEFNQQTPLHLNEHNVLVPSLDGVECSLKKESKSTRGLDTSVNTRENTHRYHFMHDKSHQQALPYAEIKSSRSRFLSGERPPARSRMTAHSSAGRGKRYIYTVKNKAPQMQSSGSNIPWTDFNFDRRIHRNIQHSEFRGRERYNKRFNSADSFNYARQYGKPYSSGNASASSLRSSRRDHLFHKSSKMKAAAESLNAGSKPANIDKGKKGGKESIISTSASLLLSQPGEENANIEEEADVPLQSGVVRIYRQPGIETPSDEDDFITVRSKRQMLNDRREQREKEIKAKCKDGKAPRRPRSVYRNTAVSSKPSKPLAPIGTPTANIDGDGQSNSKKSLEISSAPIVSNVTRTEQIPHSIFEKVSPFESAAASLESWTDVHVNQQVMALTQTQLEEAMKPECFETCRSLAEHGGMGKEQELSKCTTSQEKSFSTSGSPLSSLLAGERIQFGAVTTPSFIPSVSQVISSGISLASSTCKADCTNEHLSASDNAHGIFFEKAEHHDDSCMHLEDSEAEAAASAVAVAAISSDDVVNNGLNVASISSSDHGKFSKVDACGLTSQGCRSNGQARSISTGEEPLPVTLPADLSVETPLPLWPVLSTPPSTSSAMFSQFPGPPPSHFPCFEMNHMLRAPIFAFGHQDESSSSQSQAPRTTTLGPGPLGAWSPSGMDSFYGAPTGFTGHFISPTTGMPGVQAPPQMVFYNHFPTLAPYGVGIMGTTFISSGKQPDWKHNPMSSAMGVGERENENITCSAQNISPSMPTPIQHLSPASPLVPMASQLPMFDMPSFQATGDVPVQTRWSHLPPAPLHTLPFPQVTHNQVDGGMQVDVSQRSANMSSGNSKFSETRSSTVADPQFTFSKRPCTQFPNELNFGDHLSSASAHVSITSPSYASKNSDVKGSNGAKSLVRSTAGSSSSCVSILSGSGNASGNNNPRSASPLEQHITSQQKCLVQQQHNPVGYTDKRGTSSSQRLASGGELYRRVGFHGRVHTVSGPERGFPPSKMKQIYVAKSPNSRAITTD